MHFSTETKQILSVSFIIQRLNISAKSRSQYVEEKNKTYSNSINEEAQNFVKELNAYKEETNKKIEEMRNKYHV